LNIVINIGITGRGGCVRTWPRIAVLAAVLSVSAGVTGCTAATGDTGGSHDPGRLSVVTSTNVYGALAEAVGGPAVSVTAFISSTGQDPHTYEASARNELAVRRADVVVENGGGYDGFMGELVRSAGGSATVLSAVRISGHHAASGTELNEHVWYDLASVRRVVQRFVAVFSAHDPADARSFAARGRRLTAAVAGLQRVEARIRAAHAGAGVAITEPVPVYLLTACGLVDRTPAEFSAAVESDTGVAAAVLRQTLELFDQHRVQLLVYNAQTSGPETTAILHQADHDGVPVVPVTETMPSGDSYVSWMRSNLAAVEQALSR
jgi:zinc/manganese transport system substrate-binding protein